MRFDEIENHLHPRWQRSILSSLLRAAGRRRSTRP
ncbi:AAA family ATPase [Sorangium sp. So ce327]